MARPKLLVVTRHCPLPENDGAGAYLFDLLSHLAAHGVNIRVVWVQAESRFVKQGSWRVPARFRRVAHLEVIGSLAVGPYRLFWWGPFKARVLGLIKSVLTATRLWREPADAPAPAPGAAKAGAFSPERNARAPGSWSDTPTHLETHFYRQRLRAFAPDAVLANYCWMAPLLEEADAKKLVLAHDVASHRLALPTHSARQPAADLSPATRQGETRLLSYADTVLAISREDADVFATMVPTRRVLVVPKAATAGAPTGKPVRGRCLFVGGANPPNREGLEWFLREVWPSVRASREDATLHVCGAICSWIKTAIPEGVTLLGRVPELESEYGAAEVVVVPLLHGTGVKIKLVEACSMAKACVTTPVGLQGLAFLRNAVLEATDAASFSVALLRALDDPSLREELQKRTANAVAKHLSPEACYQGVLETVRGDSATAEHPVGSNHPATVA